MLKTAAPLLGLCLLPAMAAAQVAQEPRVEGMGGALRADAWGNSAMTANPAGLSRLYTYAAELQYTRAGLGDLNAIGANIVDSKTQRDKLAVGVAYNFEWADGSSEQEYRGHDARMGFAHPLVPGQINFGVGLHYVNVDRSKPKACKEKDSPLKGTDACKDPDFSGFTLDLGLQASLDRMVVLGIVGENIVHIDDPSMPRRAGGGVAIKGDSFLLEGDVAADFDSADSVKPVFALGTEILLANVLPLRLGYENNRATDSQFLSGSLGFVSSDSGESTGSQIVVSYRQNLEKSRDFHLTVGLAIFL